MESRNLKHLFFDFKEETQEWHFHQFRLSEVKETYQWKLTTGTKSMLFDSIYDVLGNLYKKGYSATFKLPKSMEDVPSSCSM